MQGVTTAPSVPEQRRRFRIIHRFHPLYDQEFELVQYRRSWGTAYLDYQDKAGKHGSIPLEWTDAECADAFLEVSCNRSYFRVEELLRLVELVESLRGCKEDYAQHVKLNLSDK